MPSVCKRCSASRTTGRETEKRCASWFSVGSRSPAEKRPDMISSSNWP